jgi:hypothetical protein
MPTYSFRNKDTDEVFDKMMRISEREQYLAENPNLEVVITAPGVTGELTSRMKPDQGFRDVLREIKKKHNKVWTPSKINTF